MDFSPLFHEVSQRKNLVHNYLFAHENKINTRMLHLQGAVYSYLKTGGKALRSAIMMFACGAVGGNEHDAIPAAAAIELYHTFTLVHDDIIDRDLTRRGGPTVHAEFSDRAQQELGLNLDTARHYGLSLAILAGDIQQGWAVSTLAKLFKQKNLSAELTVNLIDQLFSNVQLALLEGEALDIRYAETPIEDLTDEQVLNMLWKKTGALYEYAGRAGAAIGLQQADLQHEYIDLLAKFAGQCGTAFQVQDDILGITGNEAKLGKPVGSDIYEGKRTLIVLGGFANMTPAQKTFALDILGNKQASSSDVQELISLLKTTGGIEHARQVAHRYIANALDTLAVLPDSHYKQLLEQWAHYMIEREF